MAKKSSNNAIKKIDEQISNLESKEKVEKKESVPIINKKDIDKALIKTQISKNTISKKTNVKDKNNNHKSNLKEYTVSKNSNLIPKSSQKSNLKEYTVSLDNNLSFESNQKYQQLENKLKSLYDTVDDIVSDLEFEKIDSNNDIIINDFDIKNKDNQSKLDNVSISFLNRILKIVFFIFLILFIIFIGFVIFVSTF